MALLLLLDNDEAHLNSMTDLFQNQGHSVLCARDTDRAYQLLTEQGPDIILGTWDLEGTHSVADVVRSATANRSDIKLFFHTGYEEELLEGTIEEGDSRTIRTRPINLQAVLAKIEPKGLPC